MIHDLKILPIYFEAVALGIKTFEVRKDDRPYQVGDTLLLREYGNGEFTGKKLKAKVTYILRDSVFCKDGYCIMGIKEVDRNKYISRADVEAICHDIYLRSDEWTNEGITAIDTADEILERVDEKIKEKESENNFNDTDIDADVQPVNQWISVKDRLPGENTLVLCYARSTTGEGNSCFLGAIAHGAFWFLQVNDIGHVSFPVLHWEVTHWQPLPKSPKGGDAE